MIELKHEKTVHKTLDLIKLIIQKRWFLGTNDDYVRNI